MWCNLRTFYYPKVVMMKIAHSVHSTGVCKRPKPVFVKKPVRKYYKMKVYSLLFDNDDDNDDNVDILLYCIYFPRTSTLNFVDISKKIIILFTSTSIGNCHKGLEINLVYFV